MIVALSFMMAIKFAEVESGFNCKERTGSYKGLFQLSDAEFEKYRAGPGSIWDCAANARAAANKFMAEAEEFKDATGHDPDDSQQYMIHQQGIQGAIEHYSHPDQPAWKSMCDTDEGKEKGERWCKKAIWGNMLPSWKRVFRSVQNVTSGSFTELWTHRIENDPR